MNEMAENGKIEKVIGREKEMSEIIRALARKKKNNVIIVGDTGVGKTALGEGLAEKIVSKNVPCFLSDKIMLSVDMDAILAGTTLRGMYEGRIQDLINSVKNDKKFILFIDNIDSVLGGSYKNDYDVGSAFSKYLANGDIQIIGACGYKGYHKTFDKNPSLARIFHKLVIDEPTTDEAIEILKGISGNYESFHNVSYTDEVLEQTVKIAEKYITDRNLPDSAVDLIDEAGADKSIYDPRKSSIVKSRNEYNSILSRIEEAQKNEDFELMDKLAEDKRNAHVKLTEETKKYEESKKNNPIPVTIEDILSVVSDKIKIPLSKLDVDDRDTLVRIEDSLLNEIVGQDEAISVICKSLKRNRVGLRSGRTMGSFMFIGSTGTGKTLLAKKLAKEMFGDEKALVRFDMSEYSDRTSVTKLIGSNPGYSGYEEGGLLTEAIKNRKHCILLLDEIEKADKEVYNIFLQVLDEGSLTDNTGQKTDFRNVIIILTSNVGASEALSFSRGMAFGSSINDNSRKILTKELKNKFPPEFINRLDEIVYFNRLDENSMKKIVRLELDKTKKKLLEMGHIMTYDESCVDYIYRSVSDEDEYGARPIIRAIQNEIEDPITDRILESESSTFREFRIRTEGERLVF